MYKKVDNSLDAAKRLDKEDPLHNFSKEFCFPTIGDPPSTSCTYFAGHSLGLMPKRSKQLVNKELEMWSTCGVLGHSIADPHWISYHEHITSGFAHILGAKESEVVAMNSLTVNLHLMLVSFYKPTKDKFKILIENTIFPSDRYALESQVRFHGFDPKDAIIELKPELNKDTIDDENILQQIDDLGESLALIILGNVNYFTGQYFDIESIVKRGHKYGAIVGFDLAHGAGNVYTKLHDWNVDFAVWCTYKYLNSGPGGIGGAFIHQNHLNKEISRFQGWWGTNKKERFLMKQTFNPIETVEAWQLSNPPIFQLASLRGSMEIFQEATMPEIVKKSEKITSYLEFLLNENCKDFYDIITPKRRGSMLSIKVNVLAEKVLKRLNENKIIVDLRKTPYDILRVTPIALYNSYKDVFNFVEIIKSALDE